MTPISVHDNVIEALAEVERLSKLTGRKHVYAAVKKRGRPAYEVHMVPSSKELRRHLYGEVA